jgi:hypothetical protein
MKSRIHFKAVSRRVDRVVAGVPARLGLSSVEAQIDPYSGGQGRPPPRDQRKMDCHSVQSQESVERAGIAIDVLIPTDQLFVRTPE